MDVRRRAVLGLGLAGGLAVAAARAAEPLRQPMDLQGDPGGRFAGALADIDAYAGRHMEVYGLPGLTLAIVGPDGLTAFLRYGYADLERREAVGPDHLFQIGSISKSFMALCIFSLMEEGKLTLDGDVRDLLPGVPLPGGSRITVQNLLNHSAGLPDDAPLFPRGGDGRLWRGFESGTQWSYSNLGFQMLGVIASRLDRQPLSEIIERRVLRPLGMSATKPAIRTADRALYAAGHSGFYSDRAYPRAGQLGPAPWTDMSYGSGCVASTARDMAIYARWLIAAGNGKGAPVLSDAGAARFTKATIDAPGWAVPGAKYANGLAVVDVGGRPLLHHTGGMLGFNSAIHIDPKAGVGAFASTNVGLVPYRPRDMTAYACARLREAIEGGPAARPTPAPPARPDTAPYLGRYVARDGAALEVTASARGLAVQRDGQVVLLELSDEDAFSPIDPRSSALPLAFRRAGKAVVRAWWDGVEFVRVVGGAPAAPYSPPTPPQLQALTGHYECDDPWAGSFWVTAQGPGLFMDDTTPLVPLPDGSFRIGEKEWSPERMRFEAMIDGRPQRAVASGVDRVRRAI